MASGIKVPDCVKQAWSEVSLTKSGQKKLKYVLFGFDPKMENIIIIEKSDVTPDDESEFDEKMNQLLPQDDVRYLAYDFKHNNQDDTCKSTIMFISWIPQSSPVRKRMVAAATLNAFRTSLSLGKNVIESETLSDCNEKEVLDKIGGRNYRAR